MNPMTPPMTPLRQRFIEDMEIRNLALNTQKAYVEQVARFAGHFHVLSTRADNSRGRSSPAARVSSNLDTASVSAGGDARPNGILILHRGLGRLLLYQGL